MADQALLSLRERNPDVLTCIANLSSDEVFTPPDLANQMLDAVAQAWADKHDGEDIWSNPQVKFLDPCAKSGIFLREITARLTHGLADEIPDLQERVDHILRHQVYGIAITNLTGLMARRSIYCTKWANGEHSVASSFDDPDGNIWFQRVSHHWVGGSQRIMTADELGNQVEKSQNGRCSFCGAPQIQFDRDESIENYAYAFIHTDRPNELVTEIFGEEMQFDVVVGNPPYQMTGGAGGTNDSAIYHLFVRQALQLEPQLLCMVIPSRWMVGGRGMEEFREEMLKSGEIRKLVDYPVSKEVFPGVEVKGGICYFLWADSHEGPCEVTVTRGDAAKTSTRNLDEFDVFIRDPLAVSVLRKVLAHEEDSIMSILTSDTPFGLSTNFADFRDEPRKGDIALHYVKSGKRGIGYVSRDLIGKNENLIDDWKVLVPKAGSDGGQKIPDSVVGKPWISGPPSVATQTFLAFTVDTETEARSLESYYRTKFFRFMVSLRKITQDALRPMYLWVPVQKWDQTWSDADLYAKYGLTKDEQVFIESAVKPMTLEEVEK